MVVPFSYGLVAQTLDLPWINWLTFAFAAGCTVGFAYALVWWVAEAFVRREREDDRAFSDAPPGVVEFPMEIVLYDAGADVEADRGFAWFDDGRLIFNGAACSFALAADDFYKRGVVKGRNYYGGVPKDALRLGTYGRTAYVRLRPLMGLRGLGFRFTLQRFLRQGEQTDATRQWPPLVPYEVARAIGEAKRAAGFSLQKEPRL